MRHFWIILPVALFMSACVSSAPPPPPPKPSTPIELGAEQIQTVQSGVRAVLKDPESARFGRMLAAQDSDGVISVCGWVNAKNSFGGYTGEKPFAGVLGNGGFAVAGVGGTDIESSAVLTVCNRNGVVMFPA